MQETIQLFCLSGLFLSHHALPPHKSYFYMDQKLSWTDAQQHCRERNGDLSTVDNVADLQHLQESRTGFNYDDDFMWIGLYDDRTLYKTKRIVQLCTLLVAGWMGRAMRNIGQLALMVM
ncbi:unnamed protein product [Arctogadus glacialis]